MKKTLLQLLPAVAVVLLYLLLAGNAQIADLRKAGDHLRSLGTAEDHEVQVLQLQGEKRRLQADLDELRATPPATAASRPARSPSAALHEAHRRIRVHDGARILGVFRNESGAPEKGDAATALLRRLGDDGVRIWSVSLEAPWGAMRDILGDFASATNGAPVLVESLSMQPGVGNGKPSCWSMTICQ